MKNKVEHTEGSNSYTNRNIHLSTSRKQKRNQNKEKSKFVGRLNIYEQLNKAFYVLRSKRPVHPEEAELEEQKKRLLTVLKEHINTDEVFKLINFPNNKMNDQRVYAYTDSEGVTDEEYSEDEYIQQEESRVSHRMQHNVEEPISQEPSAEHPSIQYPSSHTDGQQNEDDQQVITMQPVESSSENQQAIIVHPVSEVQSDDPKTSSKDPSTDASKNVSKDTSKDTSKNVTKDASKISPVGSLKKFDTMHLSDSTVLEELRIADQRANNAAKMLETVREQIARYAEKEEMTEEDIQIMQRKQAELMEKMGEFEEITKRVQQLVGLRDVSSGHLGVPNKSMMGRKPDRCVEELPKVIVCGPGGIDHVPKIIVCEGKDRKQGVHQQMPGQEHFKQTMQEQTGSKSFPGQSPMNIMQQFTQSFGQSLNSQPFTGSQKYNAPSSVQFTDTELHHGQGQHGVYEGQQYSVHDVQQFSVYEGQHSVQQGQHPVQQGQHSVQQGQHSVPQGQHYPVPQGQHYPVPQGQQYHVPQGQQYAQGQQYVQGQHYVQGQQYPQGQQYSQGQPQIHQYQGDMRPMAALCGYPEPCVPCNREQVVDSAVKPPRERVPKVNELHMKNKQDVKKEEEKLSVLDTEIQWAQLKWQEKALMSLLKNIIKQKDLHMLLVTEQYQCLNWEKTQEKLKILYHEHQKMLREQVHHNTHQQQLFQLEYVKRNLNKQQKYQIKRQIQRLQHQQKINILMQQNVSKQLEIQDSFKKIDLPQKLMEIYEQIQNLQQQHQKLYESLFQQIINQQELLQSQLHTERLLEHHEKEIKILKEEEKITYKKNLEEHSSIRLKTMEDHDSDNTIEEISSLTELEEQITELRTMTDKCIDKDELSIKWSPSNFKFQLRRQDIWDDNLIPLNMSSIKNDPKERSQSLSDLSTTYNSYKTNINLTTQIDDDDFEHDHFQNLAKENIQRQKVHQVLRQVLYTVTQRLDIGLKYQKLQQEKTKALVFKNIEQQQHLHENLLQNILTTEQKYVVQNKILNLYTLLQQLLQQQQFEEKQVERFENNQNLLKHLVKKNEKYMEKLLQSLKCQQLKILDHINQKGNELKQLILSRSLNAIQEKQAKAKIFKLHQLHSKIVVQLHAQQAILAPNNEEITSSEESIQSNSSLNNEIFNNAKNKIECIFNESPNLETNGFNFQNISLLNNLIEKNVEDEHLEEIKKKIALIAKEQDLNQNLTEKSQEKCRKQKSLYSIQQTKINSQEVDQAITNLHKLQYTIECLKEQASSQLK